MSGSRSLRCVAAALLLGLSLAACGAAKPKTNTGLDRAKALSQDTKGSGGERCDSSKKGREMSQYDTTGDGRPDVRKVFLAIGSGVDARLVLICRETDVNGDGKKDVIRYYDDDGRSLREEADRNFDGRMDQALVFQDGKVVREELDENYDGKIDSKIFYVDDKPLRAERDLAGRSTATQWRPDRWEYYEEGRMVRMGTDLDGDGRVDRWDRDLQWKSTKDKQAEAEAADDGTPAGATTEAPTDSSKTSEASPQSAAAKPAAKAAAAKTAKAAKAAKAKR